MSKEIDLFEMYCEDGYWDRRVAFTGIESSLAVLYSRLVVILEDIRALDPDSSRAPLKGIEPYVEQTVILAAVLTNRMNPTFVAEFWQRKVDEIAASLVNDESLQ